MDYFTYSYDADQFNLGSPTDLNNRSTGDEYFLPWIDQSSASAIEYSLFELDGESSGNNSRSVSEAGLQNSPSDTDIPGYGDQNWDEMKSPRRRSGQLEGVDETTSQRIIRRRTQNRNAQRSYRQRREDERKTLEDKLKIAEGECKKLGKTNTELHVVVEMLRQQLKSLESENTALRTSMYSMPWRKNSD